MAKISGNEIRPGMVIEYDGSLWAAVKTVAVKPGKGPAYNQVELKNLIDGRKLNKRFGGTTGSRRPRSSDGISSSSTGRASSWCSWTRHLRPDRIGEEFVGDARPSCRTA